MTSQDPPLVLYGDFTDPRSYLASRRVAALAAAGVEVDWRAVPARAARRSAGPRFADLRADLERVLAGLLPEEDLPYCLAGFVFTPGTGAVAGYAAAYAAGAAACVRQLLFDAFWVHGCDLGDPLLVRTLVVDAMRSSAGVPHPGWTYPLTARGESRDAGTRRLVARWADEWRSMRLGAGPVLRVGAAEPLHGTAALAWLGAELTRRGVDPVPSTAAAHPRCCADLGPDRLPHAG